MNESIKLQLIKPQSVWSAWIAFQEDNSQGKVRPVVVLDVDRENVTVLVLPIFSSQPNNRYDVTIGDWEEIPLDHFSTIKTNRYVQIPLSQMRRRIGRLSNVTWEIVQEKFMQMISEQG